MNVNFVVLITALWLYKMLTLGEVNQLCGECTINSLYYFCKFSVSLKLVQKRKFLKMQVVCSKSYKLQ